MTCRRAPQCPPEGCHHPDCQVDNSHGPVPALRSTHTAGTFNPTMANQRQAETLAAFKAAHGRLCTMYAHAITIGFDRTAVAAASRGEGTNAGPTLDGLKHQRARVNQTIRAAQTAGVTARQLVNAATAVKKVVAKEWDMQILLHERKR